MRGAPQASLRRQCRRGGCLGKQSTRAVPSRASALPWRRHPRGENAWTVSSLRCRPPPKNQRLGIPRRQGQMAVKKSGGSPAQWHAMKPVSPPGASRWCQRRAKRAPATAPAPPRRSVEARGQRKPECSVLLKKGVRPVPVSKAGARGRPSGAAGQRQCKHGVKPPRKQLQPGLDLERLPHLFGQLRRMLEALFATVAPRRAPPPVAENAHGGRSQPSPSPRWVVSHPVAEVTSRRCAGQKTPPMGTPLLPVSSRRALRWA